MLQYYAEHCSLDSPVSGPRNISAAAAEAAAEPGLTGRALFFQAGRKFRRLSLFESGSCSCSIAGLLSDCKAGLLPDGSSSVPVPLPDGGCSGPVLPAMVLLALWCR